MEDQCLYSSCIVNYFHIDCACSLILISHHTHITLFGNGNRCQMEAFLLQFIVIFMVVLNVLFALLKIALSNLNIHTSYFSHAVNYSHEYITFRYVWNLRTTHFEILIGTSFSQMSNFRRVTNSHVFVTPVKNSFEFFTLVTNTCELFTRVTNSFECESKTNLSQVWKLRTYLSYLWRIRANFS